MQKLQDPGEFGTLDTKLRAAPTRSKRRKPSRPSSREDVKVLLIFNEYFRTSEEARNLYQLEDLLKVTMVGDTIDHLRRFVNQWDRVRGDESIPEEASARGIFMCQARECPLIKLNIELCDSATKTGTVQPCSPTSTGGALQRMRQ